MILITTSRRPSPRTRSLCRDLARVIPGSKHVNRGKMSNDRLLSFAESIGARSLAIIGSEKGNPSSITFLSSGAERSARHELCIRGIRLQREFKGAKNDPPRKLFVFSSEGSTELDSLTEVLSRFLDCVHLGKTGTGKAGIEPSEKQLALRLEEKDQDIILRFIYLKSSEEIGPQIRIRSVSDSQSRGVID